MNKQQTDIIAAILQNYFCYRLPEPIEEEVQSWLVADEHAQEKDQALLNIWESLEAKPDKSAWVAFEKMRERLGLSKAKKAKPRLGRRIGLRVAAVLIPAMMITAGAFWLHSRVNTPPPPEVAIVSVKTSDGSRKQMVLSDQSEVWINAGTTISYAEEFSDRREVRLEGEAYFVVEKDPEKPFVVQTGAVSVVVSGTSFNVNAYPDRQETVVILDEGSVEVDIADRSYPLEPGKQLVYNHATGAVVIEDAPDRLNWHMATLEFDYSTLIDIFRSIEVIYNVEIDCQHPIREDEYFSVRFSGDESLEEVLSVLEFMTERFTSRIAGNRVIILYR